ncbi:hypothetical protein [Microvirga zambiensis]|nr:hypothetical protein [Microvirga zambiensis]
MTMDSPAEARSATVSTADMVGWSGLELIARLAEASGDRERVSVQD